MAASSDGFIDRREQFKNKKKSKSYQYMKPVSIDIEDEDINRLDVISGSPSCGRFNMRSQSNPDIQYVMHNAILREDLETLERVLEDDKLMINSRSSDGMTGLQQACSLGNLACVKLLVEAGADLLLTTKDGRTALQIASGVNFEVAEYLLSKGAQDEDIKDGVQS
ncbi:ankyrin repeat and SOCS box protein 10-like [Hydractinia symbiolongicarpus]|uniref:ankyrin repeat and SOCS box protein 10-like n=1 Tax=Hydractinia symbiolongicarpus TaxID=13093 RepID=UPI00254E8699|nr:ankyrin repeat and SOCS box protein 10-like [Hydractinia symbiolongicarpus]